MTPFDAQTQSLLADVKRATAERNLNEINRVRKEFYNLLAERAKKDGDLLHLNLLAACDEAAEAGLIKAAGVISTLLMFYSLGREPFEALCAVMGPMCLQMTEGVQQRMNQVKLENMLKSDSETED